MYKNKLDTVDVILDFRVFSDVQEADRFIHLLVLGPQLNTKKNTHYIYHKNNRISFHLNIKVHPRLVAS